MRKSTLALLATSAVFVMVLSGIIGWKSLQGHAAAKAPWQAALMSYLCNNCNIAVDASGKTTGTPEAGDPNGRQDVLINFINKLDAQGCEWQWDPNAFLDANGHTGYNYNILFRC